MRCIEALKSWCDRVSIRTRPFGRVMHEPGQHALQAVLVSIRTRPFGRVMPAGHVSAAVPAGRFNPHPAFRPGDAG